MDEQTHVPEALARSLRDGMKREAMLFARLGTDVDRLRDSFQAKAWTESLTIAQGFEQAAREIEAAEEAREAAFRSLAEGLGASVESGFHDVLLRVPVGERTSLYESYRDLRVSVFRLKSASGRLRYSTETMADILNRILESVLPHRRGKIYGRQGKPTAVPGSLLIDREL
jgi:hypothetical protein